MYGYLDESGAPGVATNDNDYLVISLVLFADKESADKCSAAIDRLRKRLNKPNDYEFHHSRNSTRPQNGFIKLIPNLDFRTITIAIRKNDSYKHASYDRMAQLLLQEIVSRFPELHLEMDSNPNLYAKIKRHAKNLNLYGIRIKQTKSHSNNLIQLADYVAALSSRKLKGTTKAIEQYRPIIHKQIVFIDISL